MRGFVRYPILINLSSTSQLPIAARETSEEACERSMSGRFDAQRSSQAYFCDTRSPLRSRSVVSRFTLRSSIFWNVRLPLRSRSPRFLPAPLSAHMRWSLVMLWPHYSL